jgi:hypothetical protein
VTIGDADDHPKQAGCKSPGSSLNKEEGCPKNRSSQKVHHEKGSHQLKKLVQHAAAWRGKESLWQESAA